MNPTQSDLHVNQLLTNVAMKYIQSVENFVAARVFPVVSSAKQSDRYATFNRSDFFRDAMKVVGPGAPANRIGYRVDTTPNFYCHVKGVGKPIHDQERANADAIFQQDSDATEFLMQLALIHREKTWASKYFAAGLWTSNATGVAATPGAGQFLQWNDGNSTPIEDIRAGKQAIKGLTGFNPNKLTIGEQGWNKLVDHPDIVDRIKYGAAPGSPAIVTKQAVAALLEIDEVLVMGGIEETAKEGATSSMAWIGGKGALLSYAAPRPSRDVPSAGYTFAWSGYMGATADGIRVLRYRDEPVHSDVIEVEMAIDQKLTSADLGYFFASAVA